MALQRQDWLTKAADFAAAIPLALSRVFAWVIFLGSLHLSLALGWQWALYLWMKLFTLEMIPHEQLVHRLLSSFELLILIPLPVIVGRVVFIRLCNVFQLSDDESAYEQKLEIPKRLIMSILATVTSVKMVEALMLGTWELEQFLAAGVIMISITVFLVFALGGGIKSGGGHH